MAKKIYLTPVDLERMPDKKSSFELDLVNEVSLHDDEMKVKHLKGVVEFQLEKDLLLCQGKFQAQVELICDRTLEPFERQFDFRFVDCLGIQEKQNWEAHLEIDADHVSETIRPLEKLDVLDLIRQYLILEIPTKKLSSENCYNEILVQMKQENPAQNSDSHNNLDPAWEEVRRQVASWENQKTN